MNFHVGTSGYCYPEWKGSFYPKDLPAAKMLRFYGERFDTVESNYTFKRMPQASVLEKWAASVPAGFQFALKAPMHITHRLKLQNADDSVSKLFHVAGVLKKRLGPLLFQLPPSFSRDLSRLRDFLALLPSRCRVAFEFRHPSWLDDAVFELLRDHGAALCIAEAEDGLDIPFVATTDWGYVRLRRPDYSPRELSAWGRRVQEQDWRDAFVFFKHEDQGKGPQMAKRFVELNAKVSPRASSGAFARHPAKRR
jgi:uncharacterized protein YecE (DUF72 family)